MESKVKIIFHIDFNAFFCSVAEIKNPLLRDTAFAIGRANTSKGIISTASYEARKLGVKSGMSQLEALHLAPNLNIIDLDYNDILYYHYRFVDLLREYSNIIQVASIDEAYIDITTLSKKRHPLVIAKEIQTRLLEEYHLPCSIGIAPTLYLAKMASDLKKPLGISVIRRRDIKEKIYPLSVKDILWIGKKTYPLLIDKNILTIKDFLNYKNRDTVLSIISEHTFNDIKNSLLGYSTDEITPYDNKNAKSISHVKTYNNRLNDHYIIEKEFIDITKTVVNKLNNINKYASNVTLILRDINFKTINRTKKIDLSNDCNYILKVVLDLLDKYLEDKTYRMLGVSLNVKDNNVINDINLFNIDSNDKVKLNDLMDNLNKKYNTKIITYAKDNK